MLILALFTVFLQELLNTISSIKEVIMLSPIIKQHIEDRLGKPIRYHSDCEMLSFDIEKVTKQKISLNTLKRLLGFIEGVSEPRLFTLDTIALYLGYTNWDVYLSSLDKLGNSGFNSLNEIKIETLPISAVVQFNYEPDREVHVLYEGRNRFQVIVSRNSKLKVNDRLNISHFVLNYPLVILDVERDGVSLGRFTAGKVGGLSKLVII
jgi:hypothetical protein